MLSSQKSPVFHHFHDSPPKNCGLFRESLGQNKHIVNYRKEQNKHVREHNIVRSERKSVTNKIKRLELELAKLESEPTAALSAVKVKMLHSLDSVSKKPLSISPIVEPPATPEIIIQAEPKPLTKIANLGKLNKRILQSVQTEYSTCRSMVVYEAPKIKQEQKGVDKSLCYNMPTNPMDIQACYSLRALLGSEADKEFNSRLNALHMTGMNYSWRAFYEEINEGHNDKHGANAAWWRAYARMSFYEHRHSIDGIRQYIPDKYKAHFEEVIGIEMKKSNNIPIDQPKYAVWKFVKQVDEPKPPVVDQTQPKQPSVEVSTPEIPARQQVDEPVHEEPDHYDYGWQEPKVVDIPGTGFQYPTPKNPWDSSGSDFSPW